MSAPVQDAPQRLAGYAIGAIVTVAALLIVAAGSVGLVVYVWRWTLSIVRGGCP